MAELGHGTAGSGANKEHWERCSAAIPALLFFGRSCGEHFLLAAHFALTYDVKNLSSWEYPLPVEASDFLNFCSFYVEMSIAKMLELLCER